MIPTRPTDVMKFHQVNPSDVIILEGILIFHDPRVRDLMSMKIFVDTGSFLPFLCMDALCCVLTSRPVSCLS